MSQLDGNIVLIALPTITRSLNASAFEALWVLMGYILMTAVLLLAFGRLADMYGKVRLYNLGFAVFTIGSCLCSLSINGGMLVFFRLVQGVGAALIWANNAAILTDAFPPNERGRAIGVNLVAGISGSVIGLILGGILTVALGWQSIFWINLPIGAFATFWAYKKLRELGTVHHERIDLPGNVLFAGGLTAFLVGLTLGALSGYTLVDVASMGAGLLMVGGFVYVELHSRTPLMDLTLFKIRAFSAGIFSNFLASIARSGVSLVLTIYFQGVLIYDAFKAGLALIPFAVAFVSLGPLSGWTSILYNDRSLNLDCWPDRARAYPSERLLHSSCAPHGTCRGWRGNVRSAQHQFYHEFRPRDQEGCCFRNVRNSGDYGSSSKPLNLIRRLGD